MTTTETNPGESPRSYAEQMDAGYRIESAPPHKGEIGEDEALENIVDQTRELGRVLDCALRFAASLGPAHDPELDESALDDVLESIGPAAKIEIVSKLLHERITDQEFFERTDWALGYAARSLKAASEALTWLLTSAPGWPELVFDRADHVGSSAYLLDETLSCHPATEQGYAKFRDSDAQPIT